MKIKLAVLILLYWSISATGAFASVRLNEIAWMGTPVSGANEWIELYNDAPHAIDLSGWRITALDGTPNILLTGSVGADSYFLIERTDDTTILNIPADLIASFGKGFSNSGETLYLKDASSVTQDTVIGGINWVNIGGNNATRQTAQRLPHSNSWITATATPRAVNVSSSKQRGTPAAISPHQGITVSAGADRFAFTDFPVVFSGRVLGLAGGSLQHASYRWNFGDGATAEGSEVTHSYHFAGEYAVTLEVSSGTLTRSERIVVSVADLDVVIARMGVGADGFIELSDRSGREVDLSGWSLVAPETGKIFFFPSGTLLPLGKSIRFPNIVTQLGDTDGERELHTPKGALVYRYGGIQSTRSTAGVVAGAVTVKQSGRATPALEISRNKSMSFASSSLALTPQQKNTKDEATANASGTAAVVLWARGGAWESASFFSGMLWFLLFIGLLLAVFVGLIIHRSRTAEATIADEYTIIEDPIEGEADWTN